MSNKLEEIIANMAEQQKGLFTEMVEQHVNTQAQISSLINALQQKLNMNNPFDVETVQPAQAVAAINDFNESLGGYRRQRAVIPVKSLLSIKSLIQQT